MAFRDLTPTIIFALGGVALSAAYPAIKTYYPEQLALAISAGIFSVLAFVIAVLLLAWTIFLYLLGRL
jgi:hypothetical protein